MKNDAEKITFCGFSWKQWEPIILLILIIISLINFSVAIIAIIYAFMKLFFS